MCALQTKVNKLKIEVFLFFLRKLKIKVFFFGTCAFNDIKV